MMRPVFALLVVVAALVSVTQAAYWGTPNVRACNTNITCTPEGASYPSGYTSDGCVTHSFNIWLNDPPHFRNGSDVALNRFTVPSGTYFALKQFQMIYTYNTDFAQSWIMHPLGLNLSITIWNASLATPNVPLLGWNSPIINDQRFFFNRSGADTWDLGLAYGMYSNLSTPIILAAGSYIWGAVGYSSARPPTNAINENFVWFQNSIMSSDYSPTDDFLIYVGSGISPNSQLGLPLFGLANYSMFTATYPSRLCTWVVGALYNLTDGTVEDPTLASLANQAGYIVRYAIKSNVLDVNLTSFVEDMNFALNVPSLSPYASVQIYTLQRQWEFGYIDWYVNTNVGYIAMQQGLAFNASTLLEYTGLIMNVIPATVNVYSKDT